VALSFTRRAEADADEGAIDMLARANVSPRPTAGFFADLRKLEGDAGRLTPAMAYLSSHPLSSAREKRFEAAARKGAAYRPALSPGEWAALRSICAPRRS
jgi:predicted Zn-dependent protease